MKKLFILLSLAGMLAFIISCIPDESFPEDTIRFTVNETEVELTKGLTEHGSVPVLCRRTEEMTVLVLFGSDEERSF